MISQATDHILLKPTTSQPHPTGIGLQPEMHPGWKNRSLRGILRMLILTDIYPLEKHVPAPNEPCDFHPKNVDDAVLKKTMRFLLISFAILLPCLLIPTGFLLISFAVLLIPIGVLLTKLLILLP